MSEILIDRCNTAKTRGFHVLVKRTKVCITNNNEGLDLRSWHHGYSQGLEMCKKKAFEEGYSMGITKGVEIGNEIGFYSGYANQILHLCKEDSSKRRVVKVCEAILQLANKFIDIDPMDEQLTDNLSKIQSKFKQLTSLLGVQIDHVTVSGNNKRGSSF